MVRARAAGSLQAGGGAERLRVCGQVSYVPASPGWAAPVANAEGKATNIGSDTGWWAPGLVWAAEHEVSTRLQNWQNEVKVTLQPPSFLPGFLSSLTSHVCGHLSLK